MGVPSKRVPGGSSSKAAVGDDIKRQSEFYCVRCGKYYSRQDTNFNRSRSDIYAGNNGYLPICKSCVSELYQYYCDTLGDEYKACERVCSKFDIYYSQQILDIMLSTCAQNVVMTSYIGRLATSEFKSKSYDDYLEERAQVVQESVDEVSDRDAQIIEIGKKTWGLDLTPDDYIYLDQEFKSWNDRCNIDGKSRESMVREICVLKLLQNKALMDNDIDTYKKLSETLQKTLVNAELTPKQESEARRASEKPMGVMIKMFEDERPVPDPDPEWEDVDGIIKIILVYFIGHLCKMLGLKNKYVEMYEEEMEKQSVNVPDDIKEGDSEDVFDYLLEHGFDNNDDSLEDNGDVEDV